MIETMGIVVVAALTTAGTLSPAVAMMFTLRRTRSATSCGSRSGWFSAQR
jgi:hypothetical protein